MFAQYAETPNRMSTASTSMITPVRVAAILGLILGGFLAAIMPQAGLSKVAMWPLGMGISLLTTGLITVRRTGESRWELVFAGQILGVTAVALLLFAYLS